MRIRQEPHIEYKIRIDRDAVLEAETHDIDVERRLVLSAAMLEYLVPEFFFRRLRRIDDLVGTALQLGENSAFHMDGVEHVQGIINRVGPPRFLVSVPKRSIRAIDEADFKGNLIVVPQFSAF